MCNRRGQSSAEYAIVLAVLLAALVAMQVYIKRGAAGRIKVGVDQYTQVGAKTLTWLDDSTPSTNTDDVQLTNSTATAKGQYEPYYAESSSDIVRHGETIEDTDLAGNQVTRTIAEGAAKEQTLRKVGSYQKQHKIGDAD